MLTSSNDSDFVREMKAAYKRRAEAKSDVEKALIDLQVKEIMRKYFRCDDADAGVPRDTQDLFDRKMAGAGPEAD